MEHPSSFISRLRRAVERLTPSVVNFKPAEVFSPFHSCCILHYYFQPKIYNNREKTRDRAVGSLGHLGYLTGGLSLAS